METGSAWISTTVGKSQEIARNYTRQKRLRGRASDVLGGERVMQECGRQTRERWRR